MDLVINPQSIEPVISNGAILEAFKDPKSPNLKVVTEKDQQIQLVFSFNRTNEIIPTVDEIKISIVTDQTEITKLSFSHVLSYPNTVNMNAVEGRMQFNV